MCGERGFLERQAHGWIFIQGIEVIRVWIFNTVGSLGKRVCVFVGFQEGRYQVLCACLRACVCVCVCVCRAHTSAASLLVGPCPGPGQICARGRCLSHCRDILLCKNIMGWRLVLCYAMC